MDFEFSPEQQELRAAVRQLAARQCVPERLLAWESEPAGVDEATRRQIADLGWLAVGVPEAAGGTGGSLVDLACLVGECARALVPRPIVGAIRAAALLADLEPRHPLLPQLATGERILAVALDEESAREPRAYRSEVVSSADGAAVSGAKAYVPDAAEADLHLVAAREAGGISLVLVERRAPGVRLAPIKTFGGDRQAHVEYQRAPVTGRLGAPGAAAVPLAGAWRRQVALALAEMVGGMEAVLEMTVAYVKEREQFGQKIALFQAVRHQIADMGTACTAARHLAWQAITRVCSGTEEGTELASACAYVGQAFKRLCWTGHHLHGGAGFVVEHRMRFHSERAQSLCIRYAPEAPALAEVAAALLDG
ncbi:MAG: acyl-CoA dehydrogenase family protein [Thermodesulfobacteriota bacterium]